jgi:hypothetical protein
MSDRGRENLAKRVVKAFGVVIGRRWTGESRLNEYYDRMRRMDRDESQAFWSTVSAVSMLKVSPQGAEDFVAQPRFRALILAEVNSPRTHARIFEVAPRYYRILFKSD